GAFRSSSVPACGRIHGLPNGLPQREAAGCGAARQLIDDGKPVDLVGALEDAEDARVAVGLGDGELLAEAVAAMDLERLVHHEVERLRAEDLQDRALDGILFRRRPKCLLLSLKAL